MANEPISLYRSENNIRCSITNVDRTNLLTISKLSGYPLEESRMELPEFPDGSISRAYTFENETEFRKEHKRIVSVARGVQRDAMVRSFYYRANEETPLYSSET